MRYTEMRVSQRHYDAIWTLAEKNGVYVGDMLYALLEEILTDAAKKNETVSSIMRMDPEDL